jgi:type I restriction enzyme M protein
MAAGKPVNPSTQAMKMSLTPRLESVDGYTKAIALFRDKMTLFVNGVSQTLKGETSPMQEFEKSLTTLIKDVEVFRGDAKTLTPSPSPSMGEGNQNKMSLNEGVGRLAPLAETSRDLVKQADLVYKLGCRVMDWCEKERLAKDSDRAVKASSLFS